MTLGVTIDVPAPVELYDAIHAALLERAGSEVEGLLVHLARPTGEGFQVIEVWASQADRDRWAEELLAPVLAELPGIPAVSDVGTREETFEVRGLVLPAARIAV